ncbi:MAG: AMP-binding protein [Candidatus Binatia bacterium]
MRELNELLLCDLVQARADRDPDLDVLCFEHFSLDGGATDDEVRTYADLQVNANRVASGFVARGLERGDRVALMMRNHPEFVETMIAASITGALFVPIDPRTRGEKLAFMLADTGCSGIVCADYCVAEIGSVAAELPDLKWALVLGGLDPARDGAFERVDSLEELLTRPADSVRPRVDSPDAPLQIMYTSGTTGDPKGIVGNNFRFCAASMLAAMFGYRSDERPYTGLSLTHGNAQAITLAPALGVGLRAVFSRRFTKSKLWELCRRYGCTSFALVGGMVTGIYGEPQREDDADNPVRMVVSGGMPAAIWEAFERRFAVKVLEFYGAMDGGGMAYKPVGEGPVGSFGKAMPGIEMRILDEEGRECPAGVVGEICTRPSDGQSAAVDYYGKPDASKRKIRGGWNRSGDMGHADEDGWLFFDYRVGGGIRHNGDFINPGYVEKIIAEHPGVSDVCVYGVPAASGVPGEKDVVAAIVPSQGRSFSADSVFLSCREKLEPNSLPAYLQVLDEIPKTASEKPQERLLLERFDPEAKEVFANPDL